MNFATTLIISLVINVASGQLFGKYGQLVTYVINGFMPPRSLFQKKMFFFDHRRGEAYRDQFQKAYGMHGEELVSAYGRGLTRKQLSQHGLL